MDQFSEELKRNYTWLKLLVVGLSVLHVLFDRRKENNGTRRFSKERVEKKANKYPGSELLEMLIFNSRFVGYVFLSTSIKLDELRV